MEGAPDGATWHKAARQEAEPTAPRPAPSRVREAGFYHRAVALRSAFRTRLKNRPFGLLNCRANDHSVLGRKGSLRQASATPPDPAVRSSHPGGAMNPAAGLRIARRPELDEDGEVAEQVKALTDDERRALLAELPDEWRPFRFLFETGLREAIEVRWRDVDLGLARGRPEVLPRPRPVPKGR